MKFLCIDCDAQMTFEQRQEPGDGTFAAAFKCPTCGRRVALLANPMESQLVGALGVKIGGRTLDQQPFESVRSTIAGRDGALQDIEPVGSPPRWTAESRERLERVPTFVRGMVMRIYADWARQRGIADITPDVMDRARVELGLEDM
jgi:Proto-chlorophyllide reductase 57 kD subunit